MIDQSYTLQNGLKLILVDTKAFPSLSVVLFIGAGSRYENEHNNGIAHFFEHMAFKGSKNYPDAMKLASTIENFGGEFNAFTGKEYTGYLVKGPRDHFSVMLDVIADMVQNPLLNPEEIEKEKGVVLEEINMYEDNPAHKVAELYEQELYAGNALGYDTLGTKSTVMSLNREKIHSYIQDHYFPNNAVLVIAGGIQNEEKMIASVEDKFSAWKKNIVKPSQNVAEAQRKPHILVHHKKTEQSHFVLGYRTFSYFDKRKYPLMLLSAILGGGMSSRLFHEVREKRGLCYYISTDRYSYKDVGGILTRAGVRNDIESVKQAIAVILEEHSKIAQGKLTDDELTKAKEFIKGRLIMSLEDSFNVAYLYGKKKLLEDAVMPIDKVIAAIEQVSAKEAIKLAKEVFVEKNLNIALIGPYVTDALKNILK